jgi:hypothetical protein
MRITAAFRRHAFGAAAEAILLALILGIALLILSPFSPMAGSLGGLSDASAARGGKGQVTVSDGYFAGQVTATVNPGGEGVWAYAACYQRGNMVYGQYVKVDAANHATFQMGPTPSWTGGDADCVAQEGSWSKGGRWRVVAEAPFHVSDPG